MPLSQLELLYDKDFSKLTLLNRKFKINEKKVIICAPRQSGTTSILYKHIQNYEKNSFLYIDFHDFRIDKNNVKQYLNNFIKKNHITLLVIDNFDFSFKLPPCEEIIVTTDNTKQNLKNFTKKFLYPLDFEEFIAFAKKNSNIEHMFNLFANEGTYPKVTYSNEQDKIKIIQDIIFKILQNEKELKIFSLFCIFQSSKISLYKIFQIAKEQIKISKDLFYEMAENFKNRQLIIYLEKYNSPNTTKKIYLIDYTLKNALTYQKDFIKRFENIVFLELYKKRGDIYFSDNVDFYIPKENLAILSIPFLPENLLKNKILKRKKHFKKLNIKKVEIISLGNEAKFEDDNIKYEIIPFWNWANSLS